GALPLQLAVPIGPHQVSVTAPDGRTSGQRALVRPGETTQVLVPFEAAPSRALSVALTGGGLVLAAAGVGLFFLGLDYNNHSHAGLTFDDASALRGRSQLEIYVGLPLAAAGVALAIAGWMSFP